MHKTLLDLSGNITRVLGPISRHRIAHILTHVNRVSRASRPGLLVGFLRILCNGLCIAQRFHTGKRSYLPCWMSRCTSFPFLTTMSVPNCTTSFWRHASMAPQRHCLQHDLISRVFLRRFQYGIVVLGFLDAFVYAHHKHRRDSTNAGNFDCLSGRVRFMTAITLAYAHAYQTICLGMPCPSPELRTWP